ncbi:MAG: hypothetical protein LUE27_06075 [Clostridia bacterium]|nr:hypothetical protein [Clostridia bacterium]
MKFMWAVVAVLVILAIVVSLTSIFSDCGGEDDESEASVCVYETACGQEPVCTDYGSGAYEFTI